MNGNIERVINSLNNFTKDTGIVISSYKGETRTIKDNKRQVDEEIKVVYDYDKEEYTIKE